MEQNGNLLQYEGYAIEVRPIEGDPVFRFRAIAEKEGKQTVRGNGQTYDAAVEHVKKQINTEFSRLGS